MPFDSKQWSLRLRKQGHQVCLHLRDFPFSLFIIFFTLTYSDKANFLMVVSPAVLAHDVSARAGDVAMGIAVFPIGWIYSRPFEKLRDG